MKWLITWMILLSIAASLIDIRIIMYCDYQQKYYKEVSKSCVKKQLTDKIVDQIKEKLDDK